MLWQGFCSQRRLVYFRGGKVFAACGGSSIYVVARFLQPVAARLFMLWQGFCSLWRLVYLCCGKFFAASGGSSIYVVARFLQPQAAKTLPQLKMFANCRRQRVVK